MGLNRFLYDKLVRDGAVTVDPTTNYQPGYEPSKIQNIWTDYVYKSAAGTKNANLDFTLDGATSVSIEGVALWGLNLTSSYQTLKLQKWTGSWVDVGDFEYDAPNGRGILFFTPVSHIKYRVVMADTNVASFVQMGAAQLGDYEEISRGWEYGATYDIEDTSEHLYSKKGYLNVSVGYQSFMRGVTYVVLSADEGKLDTVFRTVGKQRPFVFVKDASDAKNTMEYCIFKDKFSRRHDDTLFSSVSLVWEAGLK